MKKILFLLLINGAVYSQPNLISNPGFESHNACPNASNQINKCNDWSGVPGCASIVDVADYFHVCGTTGHAPPNIATGYQVPHGGDAYIGITLANTFGNNCNEYAQTMLIDSLTPGIKYKLTLYANLAGKGYFNLASNKLGALFTTYQISSNVLFPSLNFAHVYTDSVITDTAGWYFFSESFIADSVYKFVTIGNFFDDAHTTTIPLNINSSYAWYFIDDVYLAIDTVVATPTVNLCSSDTNFCGKQCIDFFDLSTNNPTTWEWSFPGSATPTSTLQNPTGICYNSYGSFDVTLITCNTTGCDTIVLNNFINEYPSAIIPAIIQSNDTLFALSGTNFQWWEVNSGIISGATSNFFIPPFPGNYYVIITDSNGCGASSDIVIVANTCEYSLEPEINIFPNPNNGLFSISRDFKSSEVINLKIYDVLGKLIGQPIPVYQGVTDILLQDFNKKDGIYLMIFYSDKYLYSQKMIVKN